MGKKIINPDLILKKCNYDLSQNPNDGKDIINYIYKLDKDEREEGFENYFTPYSSNLHPEAYTFLINKNGRFYKYKKDLTQDQLYEAIKHNVWAAKDMYKFMNIIDLDFMKKCTKECSYTFLNHCKKTLNKFDKKQISEIAVEALFRVENNIENSFSYLDKTKFDFERLYNLILNYKNASGIKKSIGIGRCLEDFIAYYSNKSNYKEVILGLIKNSIDEFSKLIDNNEEIDFEYSILKNIKYLTMKNILLKYDENEYLEILTNKIFPFYLILREKHELASIMIFNATRHDAITKWKCHIINDIANNIVSSYEIKIELRQLGHLQNDDYITNLSYLFKLIFNCDINGNEKYEFCRDIIWFLKSDLDIKLFKTKLDDKILNSNEFGTIMLMTII